MADDIEAKDGVPAADIVARYPLTRVVISGLPQAGNRGNQHRRNIIQELNHRLQIIAAEERLVDYISNDGARLKDSIHLTRSAKSKFSANISTFVKKLF